jgi:hypothetical protein
MPEMMAIGDSLFNGVRSLTINGQLAEWSVPAQVARALGIPFAIPDYPRNVVINFELWLREFPNLIGVGLDVADNIRFWETQPKSSLADFDNLAFASASYAHMYNWDWRQADTAISKLREALANDFTGIGPDLPNLFFAFNSRFILNPPGDRSAAPLSALDIVAQRQPGRLLVSIGANNGLWNMGFMAERSTAALGEGVPPAPYNDKDIADLQTFMTKLKALPTAIKHIYLNALPLPSQVANLMPVPDVADDPASKPGPGRYYNEYENRFGFDYNTPSSADAERNDNLVRALNAKVEDLAAGDPRIHIVRMDVLFARYDFKTDPNAQTVHTNDGKILSNLMIEGPEILFPSFWRGGFMGLDGMHPSLVGYAIMATEILKAIEIHEGVSAKVPPDLNQAYMADTLLQKVPLAWDVVLDLSLDIRRALAKGAAQPKGLKYDAVASLGKALGFKYD